jgi:hypothetical protein
MASNGKTAPELDFCLGLYTLYHGNGVYSFQSVNTCRYVYVRIIQCLHINLGHCDRPCLLITPRTAQTRINSRVHEI